MNEATPSQRIKTLHRKDGKEMSLKDYAVSLGANGTKDEKQLAHAWLDNKSRKPAEAKPKEAPKPVLAAVTPQKKTNGKKR